MDEPFDVEKWRKDHPMDYFKSMEFLCQSDDPAVRTEVFKTLYKITRLHIPDRLFKYYSLSNDQKLN